MRSSASSVCMTLRVMLKRSRYSSRLRASVTFMYARSRSGSSCGILSPYSRASSIIVSGRSDPSRWKWSSALGRRRRMSRESSVVIVAGSLSFFVPLARAHEAEDRAAVHRRVRGGRKAAAVGEAPDAALDLGGRVGIPAAHGVERGGARGDVYAGAVDVDADDRGSAGHGFVTG